MALPNTNTHIGYQQLIANSENFIQDSKFPTSANLIENLAATLQKNSQDIQQEVEAHANGTRPIIHEKTLLLIIDFLAYKKQHGSTIEKDLYQNMSLKQFLDRLLVKRPLMFMTSSDTYKLRDGTTATGGFETIGTDKEKAPLLLKDYLSYDEIQISALLCVSTPTHFINDGNRTNKGQAGNPSTFEEKGIYVGQVGARFEKPGLMEWQHMVITKEQNTTASGYGKEAEEPKKSALTHWARFYGLPYFPSYEETQNDISGRYTKLSDGSFFDVEAYKTRIRMVIEPFLVDANQRAGEQGKQAYIHAVAIGTGVWQIDKRQSQWIADVYADVIKTHELNNISDIDFSWFGDVKQCGGCRDNQQLNGVTIHFSKREPAAKLTGKDQGKLLVASYAWDGNSYPGNEYWNGALSASGDPAAACCSTIPQLQNPDINPNVSGRNMHVVGANGIQCLHETTEEAIAQTTQPNFSAEIPLTWLEKIATSQSIEKQL